MTSVSVVTQVTNVIDTAYISEVGLQFCVFESSVKGSATVYSI